MGANNSTGSSHFLFTYGNKRIIGARPATYAEAIAWARLTFPEIPSTKAISFQTNELDLCNGEFAEVDPLHWTEIINTIKSLKIVVKKKEIIELGDSSAPSIILHIFYQKSQFNVRAPVFMNLGSVVEAVLQTDFEDLEITTKGHPLDKRKSLANNNLADGDRIDIDILLPAVRKPVIYLFSPETIDVSVKLSLIPQWSLSAIYPVVPIKPRSAQTNEEILWNVRVHSNGELTEMTTGLDVAYLFWEAHTNSTAPSALSIASASEDVEGFNPNAAVLNNENSVVISVGFITSYLDKALKVLGLHTEARTSFITYWLPSLLKHKHIAFRFLPQAAYEKAAPLEIQPPPSVTTRIFMIFQGISDEELAIWGPALDRARGDVSMWTNIVGIRTDLASDKTIFRVLEWGGMEVLRSST